MEHLEKCDRLAIMGGTFDPIHNGHIAVAEAVLHKFKPRRVVFIPGGLPPHKPNRPITAGEHRYNMTMLSVCENSGFDVSRLEIDKTEPSYTVNTISQLREICPKNSVIYFIVGADSLMEILTWHGAERLLTLCEFVAVHRPGFEINSSHVENLRKKYNAKIHMLEGPNLEISSTQIRKNLASGLPVGGLMPRQAEAYARENALYQIIKSDFGKAKQQLELRLSPRRFNHTIGTIIEAEKLAAHYGADAEKARWAALLHDCAKEFTTGKKRALCEKWQIPMDKISSAHIDILHGFLGAEVARREFFITDEEILQAIRYHTIGHGEMTKLDKIIMLADYIEPFREGYPPLEDMRNLAYTNMHKALTIGMKFTNEEVKQRGHSVHPWSKDALKSLKE